MATDYCDPNVIISYSIDPGSFFAVGITQVTATALDASGNVMQCNFDVTVNDNEGPTAVVQNATLTLDALGQASGDPFVNGVIISRNDNCGIEGSVGYTGGGTYTCDRLGINPVRIFIRDVNGNETPYDIIYTVIDPLSACNQPPVAVCQNITVEADNNCENNTLTAADFDGGSTDPDLDPLTFTVSPAGPYPLGVTNVILTVSDPDGASSTCQATVTVNDVTAPIAPAAPADLYLECLSENPAPPELFALDNCDDVIPASFTQSNTPSSCINDITLVRTWTFTDNSGNTSSVSQTIVISDIIAPLAPTPPADLTVQCASDVPAPIDLTATDNCTGDITVSPTANITPGSCENDFTMVRTWTFTDDCGNSSSVSQTIKVLDDVAPVLQSALPADLTVQCASDVPAPIDLTAIDNCSGSITVSPSAVITPGACENDFTMVRTWTFTDDCGNSSSVSQTIKVLDNVAPVAPTAPADLNVQCADDVPPPVDLTAMDNCTGPITVSPSAVITSGACENDFTMVRTWTFTDACGNTSSVSQTITVKDDTAPVISGCPATDIDIPFTDAGQCYYTSSGSEFDISAIDNCTGNVSLSYVLSGATIGSGTGTLTSVQFNYGETTVVWTVTDDCGNSSSCTFDVNVNSVKTITTVTVNPTSQQYSDLVEFEAAIQPWNCLNVQSGDVVFYVGTQAMGAAVAIGADGKAKASYPLAEIPTNPSNGQMSPGVKTVMADFINTDPAYSISDPTTDLTITQENANVEYVGVEFQATGGSNSSEATIELRAVLQSVPDGAGLGGDIRNACVYFDIAGTTVGPLTPELIDPTDLTTGSVVLLYDFNIGSADFESYDVKVTADCYFVGEDQTVVTVYKPVGDFITGGGHIKPTNSAGIYASTPGLKTNFGFHVKFNKKGKNLQGGMNIIFRQMVGNEVQLFQIKTNAMSSLGINIADPDAQVAEFVSKANMKNLTTGEGLGGNLTLQVKIIDRGEPGENDEIAITLWSRNTLLYSSEWTGLKTDLQYLVGGNTVVHAGFSLKEGEITTGLEEIAEIFDIEMYPNPTKGEVTLKINAAVLLDSEVVVRSITGSEVFRKEYKATELIKIDLSEYVSGIYLVSLQTGENTVVKKLILDRK